MLTFVQEAGFPIWFVLVFGIASLLCSARYLRDGGTAALYAMAGLALATLLAGALGTAVGLQASVRYIHSIDEKWLFLIGLREALNNLVMALCVVLVDVLVATARVLRRRPGREVRLESPSRGAAVL
jgi:hypothetical protein